MKHFIAPAFAALAFCTATTVAVAGDQPSSDRSFHTMGNSGKLPASGAVGSRVPDMGAGTGSSSGTTGTSHRMGDEGRLPATNSMSGAVPKMTGPKRPEK